MQENQAQPLSQPLNPEHPTLQNPQQQSFSLHQSKAISVISHQSTPQHLLKYFTEYTPHSSFPIQKVHSSPTLKLKKYKESVYYGQYSNSKRNGYGIMIYNNNRIYQGTWVDDIKSGTGYQKFANQCVYEGGYKDGKPHGEGKYVWANGEFYQGEWKDGVKNGSGMWRGVKGDTYIGEWKDGKADGYGVHTWVNGDRYEGEFKECLKNGQGIEKFANGDIYNGQYKNGKPSGFGQYYWQNSSYFKGQFINGLREGQGIWKRNIGRSDKYQGQYKNDKKQGYGIFTWATGNIYKGQYKGDIRDGYGEMFWSDGSYYKGQWKNGIQNGEGELYVPGEGVKKGVFQDNVLVVLQREGKQDEDGGGVGEDDPEKMGRSRGRKGWERGGLMPSKIPVRSHKSRSIKPKPIDQNIIIRYTSTQPSNPRSLHPLLRKPPQKRQQKFLTIQRNAQTSFQRSTFKAHPLLNPFSLPTSQPPPATSQKTKSEKQRILHSSFYMHQIHNRATTSIHGSRAQAQVQIQSGYSGSVEHRGRRRREREEDNGGLIERNGTNGGRKGNVSTVVEEMRYFNRTRLSRDVRRTPNM